MSRTFDVSISIRVHDPKAFAAAARKQAQKDGLEGADLDEYNEDNLTQCGQMLFDPGESPAGCEILGSYTETWEDEE